MQADRELLEKAARAAGIEFFYAEGIPSTRNVLGFQIPWNPLEDDGDALRLAVKLRLLVDVSVYRAKATDGLTTEQVEPLNSDPCAATRRAIVRAAAALCDAKESGDEQ